MKQTQRKFGITLFCVFSLLALLFFWRGVKVYYFFFSASVVFLSLGIFAPPALLPMQKGGEAVTAFLESLITKIVLFFVLYFVITPVSFMAKIFQKKFLDLNFAKTMKTSWIFRETCSFDKEECERQF